MYKQEAEVLRALAATQDPNPNPNPNPNPDPDPNPNPNPNRNPNLAATQDRLARAGARVLLAYEFRGELFDDLAYFEAANARFECEAIPLQS